MCQGLRFITSGYDADASAVIKQAVFEYSGSKLVVVKDIEFYSMCEHHILPFFGKISIGYLPKGEMVGLSKLARLVNVFARRLQVQERLTAQVVEELSRLSQHRWCDCGVQCPAYVHEDARCGEAGVVYHHGGLQRYFASSPELRQEFLSR